MSCKVLFNWLYFVTIIINQKIKATCYPELGCFPASYPWWSILRPFPEPMRPYEINTKLHLYTRGNEESFVNLTLWPTIGLHNTPFGSNRLYNVFLVHGFLGHGNTYAMQRLKKAYLSRIDANVFIVDWSGGAQILSYPQAASNCRIVGAELARFGRFLRDQYNVSPSTIHAIGHSLGGQVVAYFGKMFPEIGRITSLDPAQPGFAHCDERVHISKNDATFVDVIHTDVRPFIFLGFGMLQPVGDVDIYVNGGVIQPGCEMSFLYSNSTTLNLENAIRLEKCFHMRVTEYFAEALERRDCVFWAHAVSNTGGILGLGLKLNLRQLFSFPKCTPDSCTTLGLETINYPARGVFLLSTHSQPPYCKTEYR